MSELNAELERILAEPKPPSLSPHFSQRVMANLPGAQAVVGRPTPWLRAYWILFGFFVIWQMASLAVPWWIGIASTPILFVMLATPSRTWARLLAPMLQ